MPREGESGDSNVLRIHETAIELVRDVIPLLRAIERSRPAAWRRFPETNLDPEGA